MPSNRQQISGLKTARGNIGTLPLTAHTHTLAAGTPLGMFLISTQITT